MIKIEITGNPIPKARHRDDGRGGKYDPQSKIKNAMKLIVKSQMNGHKIYDDAVFVRAYFYMPRPKGHLCTGKNSGNLRPSAPKYHIKKPDIDNLVKFIYDVFNSGLVWLDDSQVISEFSEKKYCEIGETPRTEITVMEMGE